ncbi:MAG: DUF2723 domain-containing protein [Candidatus Kapaibacteriota bacterium]
MDKKLINRIFAILAFVVSFITYALTVQPSVPFWDCGEFSGATVWQQVPHPPGAPLFLMVAKLFHLFLPFGDPGWKINMTSVFADAFIILLVYLITYRIIENLMGKKVETTYEAISVYGSSLVAALAFNFSDTFWFNGVESEVYASSTLFVALIIYLMMRWNEEADNPGNEKYLLLIAYLIGLSTGVHLLSILTIFSLVYLVYFRKYQIKPVSFIVVSIISVIIFSIIYPGIVKWIPALLAGHSPTKNDAHEYMITDSLFLRLIPIILVLLAGYYLWYSQKKSRYIIGLVASSFLLMIIGYTTYTQILIRSNSNPPMNENEPKNIERLVSYLGREQYGEAPMWPRRYQTDSYYVRNYNKQDDKGNYVYGPWNPPTKKEVYKSDGTGYLANDFTNVNTSGELNYLWKYQIDHMFLRYFFWNFVGRSSDIQDAGAAWFDTREADVLNINNGYKNLFPVRFFAIPLLFGLLGLFFHFNKDPKMAFIYLVMFLMMGVLAAIQQNQQEPQPRERDYFYAGAFMVWTMWIGLGVYSIIDSLKKNYNKNFVPATIVAISMLLVPINMGAQGWKIHSRAGNYFPFDYSYNILQSVEKDAILFTNGDNDTFPVWFLQDVEGVRRDVRIVNLSLGNTLWYIDQLKNREPWGAKKVPISIPDDSLKVYDETDPRAYSYEFGEAREVTLNIPKDIMKQYTNDPQLIENSKMTFTYKGEQYRENEGKMIYLFRVQDKLIFDILKTNMFKRPIYFSATVGSDVYIGLEDYLVRGGLALRITPVKQPRGKASDLDINITEQCLFNYDNSNNFHKEPHYGFKFRNLNDPSVYYDEVHRRSILGYRLIFLDYAQNVLTMQKDTVKANKALELMNKLISVDLFPMDWEMTAQVADLYDKMNNKQMAKKFAEMSISLVETALANNQIMKEMQFYELLGRYRGPYTTMADMAYLMKDYKLTIEKLNMEYAMASQMLQDIKSDPQFAGYQQYLVENMNNIKKKVLMIQMEQAETAGGKKGRIDFINKTIERLQNTNNPDSIMLARQLEAFVNNITNNDSTK